jgi:hypothetical protein
MGAHPEGRHLALHCNTRTYFCRVLWSHGFYIVAIAVVSFAASILCRWFSLGDRHVVFYYVAVQPSSKEELDMTTDTPNQSPEPTAVAAAVASHAASRRWLSFFR